jgi:hypothetical protein
MTIFIFSQEFFSRNRKSIKWPKSDPKSPLPNAQVNPPKKI